MMYLPSECLPSPPSSVVNINRADTQYWQVLHIHIVGADFVHTFRVYTHAQNLAVFYA